MSFWFVFTWRLFSRYNIRYYFYYPQKEKKKIPDTSIIRKQPIQEPVNPSKSAKEDTITYVEKYSPK